MLAYKEWLRMYREGNLNDVQSQFFESKSPEALYNIEDDPHEINDLSNSESHQEILLQMREQIQLFDKSLASLPSTFQLKAKNRPSPFRQNLFRQIKVRMSLDSWIADRLNRRV